MLEDSQIAFGVVSILLGIGLIAVLSAFRAKIRAGHSEQEIGGRFWRSLGFVTRLFVYGALFVVLYLYSPRDITKTPLASLTLGDILSWAGWFFAVFALLGALFTPSDDEETKDLWAQLSFLILFGGLFYIMNFRPDLVASLFR